MLVDEICQSRTCQDESTTFFYRCELTYDVILVVQVPVNQWRNLFATEARMSILIIAAQLLSNHNSILQR